MTKSLEDKSICSVDTVQTGRTAGLVNQALTADMKASQLFVFHKLELEGVFCSNDASDLFLSADSDRTSIFCPLLVSRSSRLFSVSLVNTKTLHCVATCIHYSCALLRAYFESITELL